MPSVKVIDILSRARSTLVDLQKTGWSDDDLLDWFNAAQISLVSIRPDALVTTEKFLCDQSSRQVLPPGGNRLIRVDRNCNGPAIRLTERDYLDQQIPFWHDDSSPEREIEFYVFDGKEPKAFYVYPVPVSGHAIDIVYSVTPRAVTISNFANDDTVIAVEDTFQDALYDYVMYRALQKDTEDAGALQRSQLHFQSFTTFLQGKTDSDAGIKPNG